MISFTGLGVGPTGHTRKKFEQVERSSLWALRWGPPLLPQMMATSERPSDSSRVVNTVSMLGMWLDHFRW